MPEFRDQQPDRSGELPQTAGVDPRRLTEAAQARQGQRLDLGEDRTYSLLSTLLLAGIGGYAALKFFPKSRISGLAREIQSFFENPSRYGISDKVRQKLESAVSRTSQIVTEQPWAHVHVDRFGEVLGSARSAVDPEINRALSILVDIARQNPKNFANVLEVRSSKISHLLRPIPQDASGQRTLLLRDLFDSKGGWRTDLWGPMPEPYGNVHSNLQNLTKISGKAPLSIQENLQQLAKLRGQVPEFLQNMEIDPGLMIRRTGTGQRLLDIRKTQPSYWIRSLGQKAAIARGQPLADQIRSGGIFARLGNWATQLLVPTELTQTGIPLAVTGRGRKQALFLQGRLYPLYERRLPSSLEHGIAPGSMVWQLGRAEEGRYVLGRADTAMGSAARMRTRDYASATAKYLKKQEIDPQSFQGWMIRAGGKLGIGPQFALPKEAQSAVGAAAENIEGVVTSLQGRTLGGMLSSIRETLQGKSSELAGAYYARPAGQAGVKQGWSDFANYLVNRVGYLVEEGSGRIASWFGAKGFKLGIRPGKTPLGSLARWTGLGMAAYGGWQALQYIDYHSRSLIGTGPISAPLQLYAGLRTVGQYALAATGIQQTSRDLENLFPGLIDSPASRVARAYLAFRLFRGKAPFAVLGERFAETGAKFAARTNLETLAQRGLGPLRGAVERLAQSARFPERVRSAAQATAQWMGRQEGIGRRAGAAAALALAGMQLTDITESPAHLRGVFAGDINVQVREGRAWMMGTTPFGGGRVLYERPHFIASYLSRSGDIGRYGSEAERWRQSFLPTPESWFGLRPLLDPYRNERLNYQTRPYPLTAPMFNEVPFVGPLLSATLGELIKPTQRWHGEYWRGGQLQEPYPQVGYPGSAEALGYGAGGLRTSARSPLAPSNVIGRQIDVIRDFLGMPGFLIGAIKKALTGEEDFASASRQIATAGEITANERAYYNLELGGILGFSELFRRFLPHRRRATELVNPILNQAPDWLPGSRSAFAEDRAASIDLHRGDPFARLPYGEARLPGPAYEALHRLHSGIPKVYDAYDRWKILRDIAPTSQAFRHYDTIVRSWARVGALAKESGGKPLEQIYQGLNLRGVVRQVLDGDTIVVDVGGKLTNVRLAGGDAPEIAHSTFEASLPDTVAGDLAKRRLEQHILNRSVSIAVESYSRPNPKLPGRYVGRVVSGGFGGRDISTELERAHPAYNLTEQQIAEVEGTRFHLEQRFQPYPFTSRIFDDPFSQVPRNMRTLPERSLTAINTAIKEEGAFSLPEKLLGRAWESASHIVLPGPFNWPFNKFFAQRDPLEVYQMQVQGGLSFGDWNNPIEGFLRPWMNQTIGAVFPSYIPERVQRQRFAESGLDVIQYEKMQRLTEQARASGQPGMVRYYQAQASRTATHAIISGQLRFAQGALSRTERGFWVPFHRETDPRRQERILSLASPDMGAMLQHAWKQDASEAQMDRQALIEDLRNRPKADWSGFHPSVPLNAMKVKVAHQEAWDIHDFGLTHRDTYLAEDLFSHYDSVESPPFSQGSEIRLSGYQQSHRLKLQGIRISTIDAPGPPRITFDIRSSQRRFRQLYDRTEHPLLTGMRF